MLWFSLSLLLLLLGLLNVKTLFYIQRGDIIPVYLRPPLLFILSFLKPEAAEKFSGTPLTK